MFDIKKHIKLSMALEELVMVMGLSVQRGVSGYNEHDNLIFLFKPYNPNVLGCIVILGDEKEGFWIKRSDLKDFE